MVFKDSKKGVVSVKLANDITQFVDFIYKQTRYIISKIKVQTSIYIGFLINREELKRKENFNIFWKEVIDSLKKMGCKYNSRSVLFEARRLYLSFKRFTNIINGDLSIENICIPLKLSKKHLLLIIKYCKTENQQDIFIEKVVRHSLNATQLKDQLTLGVVSNQKDILLRIDDFLVKENYDLTCLNIHNSWNEGKIKNHIIKNISVFIKVVLGINWSYLPEQSIFIGGREKYLDLVFYNVVTHRYLIIELKCSCLVSNIDRAKAQIYSYTTAYDKHLDLTFQKKTIGLILGKSPIDNLYFNSSETPEYIFYSGFII